uniref:Uncharacterized protein n=1 Tax=Amphimedon queenslandica TaxID=400682 RepID=A0A1X7V491_AMPQE
MSTDLITYLNFIAGLENATDSQLQDVIDERAQFILLGKSDMMTSIDSSIDSVFDKIDTLAKQLEEEEIAEESVKLAEDAAAVAAIWSFGLSMAAFAALAATDAALKAEIKAKEDDLNDHLSSADQDIADKVGGSCSQYITLTKKNNDFIKALSPAGLTPQTARSYLYNYMDYISRNGGVGLDNFKKYIEVARLTKDDANINSIYDILDEFSLSDDQGEEQIQKALQNIAATGINTEYLQFARAFTYGIWIYKMKISSKAINTAAEDAGIPPEEVEGSVLENMDIMGKAMATFTIVMSVVDAALNVYNIVKTVERYEANVKVFADARGQYKEFYQNLYDASVQYNQNLSSN